MSDTDEPNLSELGQTMLNFHEHIGMSQESGGSDLAEDDMVAFGL